MKVIRFLIVFICACNSPATDIQETIITSPEIINTGAAQTSLYLPIINNKNIALVVNQTSTIGKIHLADSLKVLGINIKRIFAPEHGFRGKADAGEKVVDGVDAKTGIPIISLYGKHKKPTTQHLQDLDIVVFDIQDVGARFYTYISTLHNIMEACAEHGVSVVLLDRPNPNGHYVDGPILDEAYRSFVGMHPIPIVHGMTLGEYAQMINGEGWLSNGIKCDLTVIPCENYTHQTAYTLPIKPSPNLPNNRSIYLYPSLCLFEGTTVSVGRGTNTQFQVYGHPDFKNGDYVFTPQSMSGAKYPKHQGKLCRGFDLSKTNIDSLYNSGAFNLDLLLDFYKNYSDKETFFLKNLFFDKLAGSDQLRKQIIAGKSSKQIRESWQADLEKFKIVRRKYLLYEE